VLHTSAVSDGGANPIAATTLICSYLYDIKV